jgi:hypothetical protein
LSTLFLREDEKISWGYADVALEKKRKWGLGSWSGVLLCAEIYLPE